MFNQVVGSNKIVQISETNLVEKKQISKLPDLEKSQYLPYFLTDVLGGNELIFSRMSIPFCRRHANHTRMRNYATSAH